MGEMGRFLMCLGFGLLVACGGAEARPPVAKPLPVAKVESAKAREQERVSALLREGDAALPVNVDGAIQKYAQALQIDSVNVPVLWKLALAYERKEDWERVASALARASTLEPSVAAHRHRRGNALVELARAGEGDYETARESLLQCVRLDPKLADCSYLLGEVEEWADHAQAAAERYTQALQRDATQPHYYRTLAALYRVFKQPNEAERVLNEGMQRVEPTQEMRPALARMSASLAQLSAARGDAQASQKWLEQAEVYFGERAPEVVFEIGAIYATAAEDAAGVSNHEAALRILTQFTKRTCRGGQAAKFREQCELSAILLQKLATQPLAAATRPVTSAPTLPALEKPLPGLPTPKLAMQPLRSGAAYTVWGAGYALRSRQHRRKVTDQPIAVTGYVVKTNLAKAPRCAVHHAGIGDAYDCRAEIPAFWLGDRLDAPESDCIKVMGFASNYAQLFEAIRQADSQNPDVPYTDSFWGQSIPNPLPAAGAKLTVRGNYGLTFVKASSGAERDPVMGLMDFVGRDILEQAPELETLPGVKRRKR